MSASMATFSLCVFCPFFLSCRYALKEGRQSRKWTVDPHDVPAYAVSWIVLNNVLLYLYITVPVILVYVVPVLPLIVCVPVSFIMNGYLAFRLNSCRVNRVCAITFS